MKNNQGKVASTASLTVVRHYLWVIVTAGAWCIARQVAGGVLNLWEKLLMKYCGVEKPQSGAISVSGHGVGGWRRIISRMLKQEY